MKHALYIAVVAGTAILGGAPLRAEPDGEVLAAPTQLRQHRLRVAQNPTVGFTNEEVDDILRSMTGMIQRADYAWDVPCGVEFVRDGDIINDANLPVSGTNDQQEAALKQFAPAANTLLVFSISDCGGWQAAGCAPVGREPMTVISDTSMRNVVVWLHERGHVVGRDHVAQGAAENAVPENQSGMVMFWNPTSRSVGVDTATCNSYRNKNLPSIKSVAAPAAMAAPSLQPAAATAVGGPASYGLTERAFRLLDSTWVEGMPVDQAEALDPADLDSIRSMLRGSVNDLWPHALAVLSWKGAPEDLLLITRALDFPAAAPAGPITAEDRIKLRTIQRVKLIVPEAVGVLAERTKSNEAGAVLRTLAQVSVSRTVGGEALAVSLSKGALRGLALTGLDVSAPVLNSATREYATRFDTREGAADASKPMVAAALANDLPRLTEREAIELQAIWSRREGLSCSM